MRMLKAATVTFLLVFSFFSAVISNAVAQEVSVQKLLDVEEQLRSEQKKNEDSKQAIAQLEKKVQCTYKMVKGYESCDASYQDKSADYIACIQKARQEKEDCMQDAASSSQ